MCSTNRLVAKTKEKAYSDSYVRIDTKEGEKDFYHVDRQRAIESLE